MQVVQHEQREDRAECPRDAALDGFLWALAEVVAGILFRRPRPDSDHDELDGSKSAVVLSRQSHGSRKNEKLEPRGCIG